MNNYASIQLVKDLYQAVDNKDLNYLTNHLSENVKFRIGNNQAIENKQEALEANKGFFSSIHSMLHTLEKIVEKGKDLMCYGTVDYQRLDGTKHSAYFSTFLTIEDGLIEDYLVFADVSGL